MASTTTGNATAIVCEQSTAHFERLPLWKRAVDVGGAVLGLLVLAPFFAVVAILIKLSSPGPVLHRHIRIGAGAVPFKCLKFRTMTADADATPHAQLMAGLIADQMHSQPMHKLDESAPLIPFGRFLRRSCLDELPQLFNVVRGEMTLIGPRPPLPYEVAHYQPWHLERLMAVPGMTGLWQVSGKNDLDFQEMVALDLYYARHLSPRLDFAILLRTPEVIVRQLLHLPMRRWPLESIRRKGEL